MTNSTGYGCSTSKCGTCNFKFVCASSPYCCVQNITGNSNSENIMSTIVENQSKIYSSEFGMMQNLSNKIDELSNGLSLALESINGIKEYLDNIKSTEIMTSEYSDNKDVDTYSEEDNSQIVPFSATQEKIMVEKKGLFGRKKWVEEKK